MRRARARGQAGQVLVLVALLLAVLAGFLGLVIDGGGVAAEQQLARGAADGAALAGGYAVFRQASSLATATGQAQRVLVADGLPSGDLAMSYLDAGGAATSTPSLVRTVAATVTDSRRTLFLSLLGLASTQISASAQVAGTPPAPCALCAMSSALTGIFVSSNAHLTVTGGSLVVNSTANPNVYVGSGAVLAAPYINEVGSNESNSGTITPAAVHGSPVSDPYSTLPPPSVSGSAVAYTAPAGNPSIGPGVYSTISVASGSNLTLTAGVYVVTGGINVSGGSLTGAGVMIFLACSGYPTACGSGASGAAFGVSGGTISLSPPTSGAYAGMTVFADRNNSSFSTFSSAAVTVTGTWYTISMAIVNLHAGDTLSFGETDAAAVAISSSTTLTVSYVRSPLSLSQ